MLVPDRFCEHALERFENRVTGSAFADVEPEVSIIQFFFLARNKMSFNADVYVPDQGGTVWSFKGQYWMYF